MINRLSREIGFSYYHYSDVLQTSMVMSMYMTISVSVERYISVIYPLLSIRLHSRYSYLYLALPSIIFSIIFTLPTYFVVETETKCLQDNDNLDMISQVVFQGHDY